MKAPISKEIKAILKENKYDSWVYRSTILPDKLRQAGINVEVRLNGTDLEYFLNGNRNITDIINATIDVTKKRILSPS